VALAQVSKAPVVSELALDAMAPVAVSELELGAMARVAELGAMARVAELAPVRDEEEGALVPLLEVVAADAEPELVASELVAEVAAVEEAGDLAVVVVVEAVSLGDVHLEEAEVVDDSGNKSPHHSGIRYCKRSGESAKRSFRSRNCRHIRDRSKYGLVNIFHRMESSIHCHRSTLSRLGKNPIRNSNSSWIGTDDHSGYNDRGTHRSIR
jgi:hypothetical protein